MLTCSYGISDWKPIISLDHLVHVSCQVLRINVSLQEIEVTVVDGNSTETGHIIVTTIGGRNGQSKQVIFKAYLFYEFLCNLLSPSD